MLEELSDLSLQEIGSQIPGFWSPMVKNGAMGFFSDHLTVVKNLSFVCNVYCSVKY